MAASKGTESAAKDWEPLTKAEVEAERADQLMIEMEWREEALAEHDAEKAKMKAEIRGLEKQIRTAKRLSLKQRARIYTLDRKWRRQWVKYYDRFREDGKPKKDAAALAWSQVKVHCKKGDDNNWVCPPWEAIFRTGKKVHGGKVVYKRAKRKKKSKAAKAK
jgi:cation transport regulator ChaB